MSATYWVDLRERVIRSWENRRRQGGIAREFGISLGSIKGYIKRYQAIGNVPPTEQKREQALISAEQVLELQAQVDADPDATIEQHIETWAVSHGLRLGKATMCRAWQRANRPQKKTLGAKERDVVDRLLCQDVVSSLAAHHVIVIDESGTHIGMTPTYARAPRGQRAYDTTICNYGHNLTLWSGRCLHGYRRGS